jgi:hypothetical protein
MPTCIPVCAGAVCIAAWVSAQQVVWHWTASLGLRRVLACISNIQGLDTHACVRVCALLQAAPNVAAFSKGAVAGARLFAVINRKPDIDVGEQSVAAAATLLLPAALL